MNKILDNPDGRTSDLDDSETTMWGEVKHTCYENPDHEIIGSTNRLFCYECGTWWWREGYGGVKRK